MIDFAVCCLRLACCAEIGLNSPLHFYSSLFGGLSSNIRAFGKKENDTLPLASNSSPTSINATSKAGPIAPQFSPAVASASAAPFPATTLQANTENLMRSAQDFLRNILGGLQELSTNLSGILRRGAPPTSSPSFTTTSTKSSISATSNGGKAGDKDKLNEINSEATEASGNFIIVWSWSLINSTKEAAMNESRLQFGAW